MDEWTVSELEAGAPVPAGATRAANEALQQTLDDEASLNPVQREEATYLDNAISEQQQQQQQLATYQQSRKSLKAQSPTY
ncbi:hypothetical protein CCHR01_17423 [Colletotrichum chrysophilum]|uniref:Uncharacterized protein n=1 Tax=Colletotrichum chrysophilum TaxID=1836956 RepID=A0AAD9A1Z3_9PEZI|nr:hypothetical protein CCHR01_17423 [Colletotrichum chrysophilum]